VLIRLQLMCDLFAIATLLVGSLDIRVAATSLVINSVLHFTIA